MIKTNNDYVQTLLNCTKEQLVTMFLDAKRSLELEKNQAEWLDNCVNGYRDGFDEDNDYDAITDEYKLNEKSIKEKYSKYLEN